MGKEVRAAAPETLRRALGALISANRCMRPGHSSGKSRSRMFHANTRSQGCAGQGGRVLLDHAVPCDLPSPRRPANRTRRAKRLYPRRLESAAAPRSSTTWLRSSRAPFRRAGTPGVMLSTGPDAISADAPPVHICSATLGRASSSGSLRSPPREPNSLGLPRDPDLQIRRTYPKMEKTSDPVPSSAAASAADQRIGPASGSRRSPAR